MDTQQMTEAFKSKSISERAAACRELSMLGTVEHIEGLADRAATDKSQGVRLSAAAAVADILSRCRVGAARDRLNDDQRDVYLASFAKINPTLNGGVFPMIATLDRPKSLTMILGGLRDPRADVRLAAAVGLMRLCTSIAVAGDDRIEESVVGVLTDARHSPDAVAQICRVCAAAGYRSASDPIRRIELTGTHQEMVLESLGILDGAEHDLRGLWFSDGRDAGESNPTSPLGTAMMVFDSSGALLHDGQRWKVAASFSPLRRMFLRRAGEAEARPAFQAFDRTFYAGMSVHPIHTDWETVGKQTKASARALRALQSMAGDAAADQHALAHLAMDGGDAALAQSALEAAIHAKKTPVRCWLDLGDLLWSSNRMKRARAHYATYAKKGKRKEDPVGMDRAKSRM